MDSGTETTDTEEMDTGILVNILVYSLPMVSLLYAAVGFRLLRRTEGHSLKSFAFLMASAAVYSFGYFLELHAPTLEVLVAVRTFELLGALMLPAAGTLFVLELTDRRWPFPAAALLITLSLALWAVLLTNPLHGWFYRSVDLAVGRFSIPLTVKGPGYFAFLAYIGLFLLTAAVLLARSWYQETDPRRRRSLRFTFLAFQVPWAIVVIILAGGDHVVDPAPPLILATCLLFLLNTLRNDMLEVDVRRWKSLFGALAEPAYLVEDGASVTAANDAARRLWGDRPPISEERILQGKTEAGERWFEVSRTPYGSRRTLVSYLLVDITEQRRAEAGLRQLVAEKDLLLKEVHHRIKNNMSNVIGLFTLQAMMTNEPAAAAALDDASNRVQSMMVLYDKLYQGNNFREIATGDYFTTLTHEVLANFPNRSTVDVTTQIEDFPLPHRQVEPLGIILNELLTNAMKYAFRGRERGKILVELSQEGAQVRLTVQDDGIGIPPGGEARQPTGFGMTLVNTLTGHLLGTLEIGREGGTTVSLSFPV